MIASPPRFAPRAVLEMQAARDAARQAAVVAEDEVSGRDTAGLRALIVDDEPGILDIVKAILERKLGLTVEVARDGDEASRRVSAQSYDLIICDVRMPVMSGTEFLDWLRGFDPRQASRLFFMTGDYGNARDANLLRSPDVPVLPKPFSMPDLIQTCRRVLTA